jgi:hypothetical protein
MIPEELYDQLEYLTMTLKKLGDNNKLPKIDTEITFEEFIEGFSKWKEKTTTSPSGRHVGHYKLLNNLPIYEDHNTPIINLGIRILNVYYQSAMTTAAIGVALKRWISTIMIEKSKTIPTSIS